MSRALVIINGRTERDRIAAWAHSAPAGTRVEFKEAKRTSEQNDRMWAMLTDVADQMRKRGKRFTADQWKVMFMHACGRELQFIPSLDGTTFIPWGQSSSDLSKREMTDLIEFMFAWGAENEIKFHEPKAEAA